MREKKQTPLINKLCKEVDRCELCGSRRGLEVHHIVPVTCGGPDDDLDNLIVLCIGCHSRLTPRKILQRIGIDNALLEDALYRINNNFYNGLKNSCAIFASDACDIFNQVMWEEVHRIENRKARRAIT